MATVDGSVYERSYIERPLLSMYDHLSSCLLRSDKIGSFIFIIFIY